MISVDFSLDVAPWAKGLHDLGEALDDELEGAVREGAAVIAASARAEHPYTDRTGRLTRSVRAYVPRGAFLRDTLQAEVVATMPYASYVERRGYAFLEPAAAISEDRLDHHLHDALEAAVRRSGLR